MDTFLRDARYGFRVLMSRPIVTFAAVVSLALGIAVNTAIFTLVNTILLGALPYPDGDRLVVVRTVPPGRPYQVALVSVPNFMAWKQDVRSFEALGGMYQNVRYVGADENGAPA